MIKKSDIKLERLIDRCAIESLQKNGEVSGKFNNKIIKLARRVYKNNRKKRLMVLKDFRESQKNARVITGALERFAYDYNEFSSNKAKRECDKYAIRLISASFCHSIRNVINLYKHYKNMKEGYKIGLRGNPYRKLSIS